MHELAEAATDELLGGVAAQHTYHGRIGIQHAAVTVDGDGGGQPFDELPKCVVVSGY